MKPYGRSDGNVSENRRWASQIYGRALWLGPAEPVSARCGAVLILISAIGGRWVQWMSVLSLLAYIPLIWSIYRMYSRNIEARRRENTAFLRFFSRLTDKQYRYFRCPGCRQVVRVPRGKGKINIRCPKCSRQFIKRT